MKKATQITCLFLDIGGVLLTDGWNINAREQAAAHFHLDFPAIEDRHRLIFPTYEEGRLNLREYLDWTVFFEKRKFTLEQFLEFMFAQSAADPKTIELIRALKARYGMKVVANEYEWADSEVAWDFTEHSEDEDADTADIGTDGLDERGYDSDGNRREYW